MSFLELHPVLMATVIIGGSIIVSLASYFLARRLLNRDASDEAKDLSRTVVFRVAALHGFILALVFAQEILNYNSLRVTISDEAVAVGDIFYDLERYDAEGTIEIRKSLANYTAAVIEEEWDRLGTKEGLSPRAWRYWEEAFQGILDLTPATYRQEILHQILITDIREISGFRLDRQYASSFGIGIIFWLAAVVGLLLVPIAFFPFAPERLNLVLMCIFASYTGLVIFCIVAFSNPYTSPGMLQPVGFERMMEGEVANFVTER